MTGAHAGLTLQAASRRLMPMKHDDEGCNSIRFATWQPTSHEPRATTTAASRHRLSLVALAALSLVALPAAADIVRWDVDPAVSYLRLTIPDQGVNVTNVGNITIRMRDANSTSQWTDAGGRRAAIDGEIATDYVDGTAITFLGGTHNLFAVEGTNLRPNPADWNAATTNYTGTSTAPAALGGRVRGTYLFLTFDAAYLAFRSVKLDLTNVFAGAIAITNGAFAGGTTQCGIASALADADGLELPLGLGQPIPDVLHGELPSLVQTNVAGGTITNLGGLNRQLIYTINLPNLAFDLSGTVVTGSAAGLVVATAALPTPTPPPTLSARQQPGEVVLSWPTNAAGFSLEYATNQPSTQWLPALPSPVVANNQFVVTNRTTRAAAFYRLRKP